LLKNKSLPYLTLARPEFWGGTEMVCLAFHERWKPIPGNVYGIHKWREYPLVRAALATSPDYERYLKTLQPETICSSCDLAPGDSGGPLLNKSGEVIGVTCFTLGKFALHVPVNDLREFVAHKP